MAENEQANNSMHLEQKPKSLPPPNSPSPSKRIIHR